MSEEQMDSKKPHLFKCKHCGIQYRVTTRDNPKATNWCCQYYDTFYERVDSKQCETQNVQLNC